MYATDIVECGGVRALAALCDGAVHDKAVLALSVIARSSVSNRQAVHGVIGTKSVFVRLLQDPRQNLSFLLASFCRGDPFLKGQDLTAVLDTLVHLLSDQDIAVVEEACAWIRYLVKHGRREHRDALTRRDVQSKLAKLLLHSNPDVIRYSVRMCAPSSLIARSSRQT